jgi:hypothetical protein
MPDEFLYPKPSSYSYPKFHDPDFLSVADIPRPTNPILQRAIYSYLSRLEVKPERKSLLNRRQDLFMANLENDWIVSHNHRRMKSEQMESRCKYSPISPYPYRMGDLGPLECMLMTADRNSPTPFPPSIITTPFERVFGRSASCVQDNDSNIKKLENPLTLTKRKKVTENQLHGLRALFEMNHNPSKLERNHLGNEVGMSQKTIQIWFQNRRSHVKRMAEKYALKGQ